MTIAGTEFNEGSQGRAKPTQKWQVTPERLKLVKGQFVLNVCFQVVHPCRSGRIRSTRTLRKLRVQTPNSSTYSVSSYDRRMDDTWEEGRVPKPSSFLLLYSRSLFLLPSSLSLFFFPPYPFSLLLPSPFFLSICCLLNEPFVFWSRLEVPFVLVRETPSSLRSCDTSQDCPPKSIGWSLLMTSCVWG